MEEEFEKHNKMFDDLSNFQLHLKKQVMQMEIAPKREGKMFGMHLKELAINCELAKKTPVVDQIEIELLK